MALTRVAALLAGLMCACGGNLQGQGDGGTDGAPYDASSAGDGSIGPCNTDGLKLCGGQCGQNCPVDKCFPSHNNPDYKGELGICTGGPRAGGGGFCDQCGDSYVCTLTDERYLKPSPIDTFHYLWCEDERWALMYSLNGHNDMARYADRSTYTGTRLVAPATCPSVPGLQLCGGACGACPADYVCMGRSPAHPYSLCVNKWGVPNYPERCARDTPSSCGGLGDRRCLTFKVDSAAQPVADAYSLCVDRAICDAAALSYPGGAFCTGGQ